MAHAMETWTLVAEYGESAIFAGFEQGQFQFGSFALCLVGHAFGFPYRATAECCHLIGEDDLKARFVEQFGHVVDEWFISRAKALIETRWEIDYPLVLQTF